jgi:hypothetical protein
MRLSWRDVVDTVLAGAVLMVGMAVSNEWGWPLLGSPRAGSLAVGFLGIAMCSVAGSGRAVEQEMKEPGVRVLTGMGALALVLMIVGVITGSDLVFLALVIDTIGMWLMSTIRHATASLQGHSAPHAAGA